MIKVLTLFFLHCIFNIISLHAQNVGVGTDNPQEFFSVGASSQFRVNASGNLVRINDIQYNFPASQGGTNTYLRNDGSGNLSWQTLSITTGNISATGTASNTTFLRGDGAWQTPAGGVEQFPSLVTSATITGLVSSFMSEISLHTVNAPSSGYYQVTVNLAITNNNGAFASDNAYNAGIVKVNGTIVGASEANAPSYPFSNSGNGPGYISLCYVGYVSSGQAITTHFITNGGPTPRTISVVSPSRVSIVKLSN